MAAIIHLMQTAMPPRASSSKTAIIAGTLAGLLAAALGAFYVYQQAPSAPQAGPAAAVEKVAARPEEQAVTALMALPELKAWAAHIEKASEGRAHGAVMLTAPEQREVEGQSYYQLSFFENTPEAAHHWESFLVTPDGKHILVDDTASDEVLSLERWRKESAPLQRIANQ